MVFFFGLGEVLFDLASLLDRNHECQTSQVVRLFDAYLFHHRHFLGDFDGVRAPDFLFRAFAAATAVSCDHLRFPT